MSASLDRCPSCYEPVGFPNVRLADSAEETFALEQRYQEALRSSNLRGLAEKVKAFENAVKKQSKAVVAADLDTMRLLAVEGNALYSNYSMMVSAQVRQPALLANDQRRSVVDGALWGTFGSEIKYAALSLENKNLSSYGNCFAILKNSSIAQRASVLEMNSYDFVLAAPNGEVRKGYRSNWNDRHRVAVAKCASLISQETSAADFPDLILMTNGDRSKDKFIEVHIYGTLNFGTFEAIGLSISPNNLRDSLTAKIIEEKAVAGGKEWLS